MTAKFYRTLNLPGNPLLPEAVEKLREKKMEVGYGGRLHYQIIHYDYANVLTREMLEIFKTFGLDPFYIIHFGSIDNSVTKSFLHTDLFWFKDRYQTIPFSLNWDLTEGTTNFRWYNTGDLQECWPPERGCEFSGIHYGEWYSTSIDGCTEIESLSIKRNTPYLVKTDVPHQITYDCKEPMRYCVSVRFKLEDIPDWDHALKVFQPLIL